jgi:hypothetical protein
MIREVKRIRSANAMEIETHYLYFDIKNENQSNTEMN